MEYTISEVAEKTGLSPYALRFYENKGIIPKATRNGSGYRVYGELELSCIMVFLCLKSAGMNLANIRQYFKLAEEGDATVHQRLELFSATLNNIEMRLKELERCRLYAREKVTYYQQCCADYDEGLPLSPYQREALKQIFEL